MYDVKVLVDWDQAIKVQHNKLDHNIHLTKELLGKDDSGLWNTKSIWSYWASVAVKLQYYYNSSLWAFQKG